jgi:hypothetical protein
MGLAMGDEHLLEGLDRPAGAWPRMASWHANDRRLVAVSTHGHGTRSLDALAYGLEKLDGRELHLVVPRAAMAPLRARAAFLSSKVHVHATERASIGVGEQPMSRTEATAFYRRLGPPEPSPDWDVSSWPTSLVELVDWVESRRVERVRTTRDYAWHYRGRQVLYVRPGGAGTYFLVAGVNYAAPRGDQPAPVKLDVSTSSPLAADRIEHVRSAVDEAIERRRNGRDNRHREHLLQAAIGTDPSLIGVSHLRRELPAWRPKVKPRSGRAFIDFIARDVDRVGHVVETKIGPDAQLGFQALDYWAWAEAHRTELAGTIEADPGRHFELDIALGLSTKRVLHPAAAATLQAFDASIKWRCHLVSAWDTLEQPGQLLVPDAEPLPTRVLPPGSSTPA